MSTEWEDKGKNKSVTSPLSLIISAFTAIKDIKKGASVGYDMAWTAEKDTKIGIIGIGYGDGFPYVHNPLNVSINNKTFQTVGRINMDAITIDLDGDESIKIGDPMNDQTQMGPLATLQQLNNIQEKIDKTLQQGGKLVTGGKRVKSFNKGYYFEPTIIECEHHNLPTAENELFGPVLSVLRFKTEEEVIQLANDTKYGLAAGVFTKNSARSLRITKALRAGIVWVNTYRVVSPIAPFGGYKDSGYGRESGMQAIHDYTRIKTVWINTSDEPMSNPFQMR
mgnify:CR=1 FL=1